MLTFSGFIALQNSRAHISVTIIPTQCVEFSGLGFGIGMGIGSEIGIGIGIGPGFRFRFLSQLAVGLM